jgi:hypothetical protein
MPVKRDPDAAFAAIADQLHGFAAGGLVAEITKTSDEMGRGSLNLIGAVLKDGIEVGRFSRTLLDTDGHWRAFHMRFDLDPEARGGPFRDAFFKHAESVYQERGIDDIRVTAEDIGSYLWAKEGFHFLGNEDDRRTAVVDLWKTRGRPIANHAVQRGDLPATVRAEIEQKFTEIEAGTEKPLEPVELAELAADHTWHSGGHKIWLGKEMLIGWSWNGIKDI